MNFNSDKFKAGESRDQKLDKPSVIWNSFRPHNLYISGGAGTIKEGTDRAR
jgi:hypothetical protein